MLIRRHSRKMRQVSDDIDVTPFMNLMAVLCPFLLATAVFTRLAVHEIFLPPPIDLTEEEVLEKKPDEEKRLVLTISITDRGLIVSNAENIFGFIGLNENGQNLEALSEILQRIKVNFPEEENAIILSTAMIPYGTVISVMDTTSLLLDKSKDVRRVLFPNISLGEVQ